MTGSINVGDRDGTHIIRFECDIRVGLCNAFDNYCQSMLCDDNFCAVIYSLDPHNFGGDESSVVKNATVDILENNQLSLSVYPNPASNFVVLQTTQLNSEYEVSSMSGKILTRGVVENIKTTINTDSWSSGTYLVKVMGQGAAPEITRFTIK